MKYLLLIILNILCLFMTFSQTTCIEGDCQEGTGKMLIVYDDGSRCDYEGAFRYGYINGKGIFTCNEYTESGIFKNNKLIEGEYNSSGLYQRGTFVNRVLHGEQCVELKILEDETTIESKGRMVNGALFSGIAIIKVNDGRYEECIYEEGELINCKKNTENSYNREDIDGPEMTIVDVVYIDNQTFVPLSINNIELNILWDTGAFGLVFSRADYQKLLEGGAQLHNLDLSIETVGVLNIPTESYYFILDGVKIGEMTLKNVVCLYNPAFETSLLGFDFFHNFNDVHWKMKLGAISLYK
ncbi:MAG: hypothetical protein HN563_06335 [Flavobacteriales bacterium]|nr:hypothetical protein [Flavobacteriales bacterium]